MPVQQATFCLIISLLTVKEKNSCTFFKSIKWDTIHSFRNAFRKVDTCFKMKRFLARGIYHSCTENFCKRLH